MLLYTSQIGLFSICTTLSLSTLLIVYSVNFLQVLQPATRRKVKIVGRNYHKYLSECLVSIPPFLGGDCACPKCSNIGTTTVHPDVEEFDSVLPSNNTMELEYAQPVACTSENWERLKRVTLVSLFFCIFIMFNAVSWQTVLHQ